MMAFKVVSFSKEETKIPEIQEKYSELGRSSGRRLACARLHSILTPKKREKGREWPTPSLDSHCLRGAVTEPSGFPHWKHSWEQPSRGEVEKTSRREEKAVWKESFDLSRVWCRHQVHTAQTCTEGDHSRLGKDHHPQRRGDTCWRSVRLPSAKLETWEALGRALSRICSSIGKISPSCPPEQTLKALPERISL